MDKLQNFSQAELRITKDDYLTAPNPDQHVTLCNSPLQSLISKINVTLNGTQLNTNNNFYAYRYILNIIAICTF